MKKIAVFIVLILVASAAWSQDYGSFGIGLNGALFLDEATSSAEEEIGVELGANVSIMAGDSLEIRPFLYLDWSKQETSSVIDWSELTIGAGAGVYLHILKADILRMGPGAKIQGAYWFDTRSSSDNSGVDIQIMVPMMMDFIMTKNLTFRMEYEMLRFQAIFNSGSTWEYTQYDLDLFGWGSGALSLGVNLRF